MQRCKFRLFLMRLKCYFKEIVNCQRCISFTFNLACLELIQRKNQEDIWSHRLCWYVGLLWQVGHLVTKWMTDLAAFVRSFERLYQDQLFQLQILMQLADAGLGSSHFRVAKCRPNCFSNVPFMSEIAKISNTSFRDIVYHYDE